MVSLGHTSALQPGQHSERLRLKKKKERHSPRVIWKCKVAWRKQSIYIDYIFRKYKVGQVRCLTPIIQALWEAEASGSRG